MSEAREDKTVYKVLVRNGYEDYLSLWPADREGPAGWDDTGVKGTKEECLAYIQSVWARLRPHNLPEK